MKEGQSFAIPKEVVWQAYKKVKENKGSAGIDGESLEEFGKNLKGNLYKIWNRMSSGSYFSPAVMQKEIPKKTGGVRKLGIPTVSDRIAQTVVLTYIEPKLEKLFHQDSYGYRPNKSAIQAVKVAKERCWNYDWVIELDIEKFFDNLDHELLRKAIGKHITEKWILMYIDRWLKAPIETEHGEKIIREKGAIQGGVISPILANLFLHYAFDDWMNRNFPMNPFERYADDAIIHCKSKQEAEKILQTLQQRMQECKLKLNDDKTRIIYCKDDKRKEAYANDSFDFLGFTFRMRGCKGRNCVFMGFNPAVSKSASKKFRAKIKSLRIKDMTTEKLEEIAKKLNPIIRGWTGYFKQVRISEIKPSLDYVNQILASWVRRKFKNCRKKRERSWNWLATVAKFNPTLFVHWKLKVLPSDER